MQHTLPAYVMVLSNNNFETLEEIIMNKYRKFLTLYDLLENYSSDIDTLKYTITKKNKLKIQLLVKDINSISMLYDNIQDNIQIRHTYDDISIWKDDNTIYIEIIKEEPVSC